MAAVQFNPRLAKCRADVTDNLRKAMPLIASAVRQGASLVVLPELSFTGSSFLSEEDAAQVAEPAAGRTFEAVRRIAQSADCHVAYGFVEDSGGCLHNSAALVSPAGDLSLVVRKMHFVGCDHMWAVPGREPPGIVHTDLGAVSMVICKDVKDEARGGAPAPACQLCDVPSGYYHKYPCPCCGQRKKAGSVLEKRGLFGGRRVDVMAGLSNWGRDFFLPSLWTEFVEENGCVLVMANRWGKEVSLGVHGEFRADFGQGGSAVIAPEGDGIKAHVGGLVFSSDCVVTADVETMR